MSAARHGTTSFACRTCGRTSSISARSTIHCFPSAIDATHLPHPCIGFFGVLDGRLDVTLVRDLAAARPEWSLVLIGPVVKIAPDELPRAANIHYLGSRSYDALATYLAGGTWRPCSSR
jgi:UDP-galactopyranose mutase